jgi:hypothetical protein
MVTQMLTPFCGTQISPGDPGMSPGWENSGENMRKLGMSLGPVRLNSPQAEPVFANSAKTKRVIAAEQVCGLRRRRIGEKSINQPAVSAAVD